MGLILDSSVVIAAERRGETVEKFIEQLIAVTGDQEVALSSIGLTELVHGIYRAPTSELRFRRRGFIDELVRVVSIWPYTSTTAFLAGKIDAEQRLLGVTIPFADLLVGATALELGFPVLTVNVRHFRLIPGLEIVQF